MRLHVAFPGLQAQKAPSDAIIEMWLTLILRWGSAA